MTFRELCRKEIVQRRDGLCLGRADDMLLDESGTQARGLILLGRARLFGLLGREQDLIIPWEKIAQIGVDAIFVDTDVQPQQSGGKKRSASPQR